MYLAENLKSVSNKTTAVVFNLLKSDTLTSGIISKIIPRKKCRTMHMEPIFSGLGLSPLNADKIRIRGKRKIYIYIYIVFSLEFTIQFQKQLQLTSL
jgi:hypothetical protein